MATAQHTLESRVDAFARVMQRHGLKTPTLGTFAYSSAADRATYQLRPPGVPLSAEVRRAGHSLTLHQHACATLRICRLISWLCQRANRT